MPSLRLPADDLEYAALRALTELRSASVRALHDRVDAPLVDAVDTAPAMLAGLAPAIQTGMRGEHGK